MNNTANPISKMRNYIHGTPMIEPKGDKYGLSLVEAHTLISAASKTPFDSILLAFEYGRAKGYRLGKRQT